MTVHHGHMPEIELTSESTARGLWAMQDLLKWPDGREPRGYGHYHETYERDPDGWRSKTLRLTRLRIDFPDAATGMPATSGSDLGWGAEPNRFVFAQLLGRAPTGPALDLACGEDRNAIRLAEQGASVAVVRLIRRGGAQSAWCLVAGGAGHIEDGDVTHWQATVKLGFTLDE